MTAFRTARSVRSDSSASGAFGPRFFRPYPACAPAAVIEIVCATRAAAGDFPSATLLGRSLARLAYDRRLVPRVACANARGLPEVYNERIDAESPDDVLVFVHDDVWFDDFTIGDRLLAGLSTWDVIGVAGNRRRLPGQPAWIFASDRYDVDRGHLSGAIAHGEPATGPVSWYGPAPAACESLDGVLLAARRSRLREAGVRFDPRYAFHYYDLDFCRTARERGLTLGTWPICLTHASAGAYDSPPWREARRVYRAKWD